MESVWLEGDVPFLTTEQMREVDRAMVDDFGIDLCPDDGERGRNLADLARHRFLEGDGRSRSVIILAGPGGNGGGAMVAARRLHAYGALVGVVATREPEHMAEVTAQQFRILENIGVPLTVGEMPPVRPPDVIIDGLIGYNLKGAPPRDHRRADRMGECEHGAGAFARCAVRPRCYERQGPQPRWCGPRRR